MTEPSSPPPDRAERVLRTFLDEPMLWPVGLVLLLTAMTFGAAILLFAVRERALVPGTALLLLVFLSVWGLDRDFRERRLRPTSAVVLCTWLGSGVGAWLLERLGAFH